MILLVEKFGHSKFEPSNHNLPQSNMKKCVYKTLGTSIIYLLKKWYINWYEISGEKSRGSDAVQNVWMIRSAEFVLSNIRPKA